VEQQRTIFRFPIDALHQQRKISSDDDGSLCGLVLAGGEGKRLRPFSRSLGKGTLPKQYVNFIGTRSMLEHTWRRAEQLIPSQRVLTVITQHHLDYPEVRQQLRNRDKDTVIVQPENKETGHGILLSLVYLQKRCANSLVLVFPSDHFVREKSRLLNYARFAYQIVKRDPSRLVLLGIKPDRDDPEYGYIVPGKKLMTVAPDTSAISWFVEKPNRTTACRLVTAGGLWNTMIMAFSTTTMLHWTSKLLPRVYCQFQKIYEAIGTAREAEVVRETYDGLKPVNFSKQLLEPLVEKYPASLVALPMRDLLWSDWGTADRVTEVLQGTGKIARLNRPGKTTEKRVASRHKLERLALSETYFPTSQELHVNELAASLAGDNEQAPSERENQSVSERNPFPLPT
jgi:mannose-1-phosphate guanylyltransferase